MDPYQLETLARRLGENPADAEALQTAYTHGQTDPRAYAIFLEKAGEFSREPTTSAHWYCEAATVWTTSFQDSQRASTALLHAVDQDPQGTIASERLLHLYREQRDLPSIVSLYERRIQALKPQAAEQAPLRALLHKLHLEVAEILQNELRQPEQAAPHYAQAAALDKTDALAIYHARETFKSLGRYREALPYFEAERALFAADSERKHVLYLDEAEVCQLAGDEEGHLHALRGALATSSQPDPTLQQQIAARLLERHQTHGDLTPEELEEGAQLFVSLAEMYDGEYGQSYAACALTLQPDHDRAVQLVLYYSSTLGSQAEVALPVARYLAHKPDGVMAEEARAQVLSLLKSSADQELIAALLPEEEALPAQKIASYTELAQALWSSGHRDEAQKIDVLLLQLQPAHEQAVLRRGVQLREAGDFAALRELLRQASQVEEAPVEQRLAWLNELAELCEGPLQDPQAAIEARHQLILLDPSDDRVAAQLQESLLQAERWDDIVALCEKRIERSPSASTSLELYEIWARVLKENLHDPERAAQIEARRARLAPNDSEGLNRALTLLEETGQLALAQELLSDLLREAPSNEARITWSQRLGELLEANQQWIPAGGAYAEAASLLQDAALWERAESCFVQAETWEQAVGAVQALRELVSDPAEQAVLLAREAQHALRWGNVNHAVARFQQALQLAPEDEQSAEQLDQLYQEQELHGERVNLLLSRARQTQDSDLQSNWRKRAAQLQLELLQDTEGARLTYQALAQEKEDSEALAWLAEDAEGQGDPMSAAEYLQRWVNLDGEAAPPERLLRLAVLLDDLSDEAEALRYYREVLEKEPEQRSALRRAAEIEESLGDYESSVEHSRKLVELTTGEEQLEAAWRQARLLSEQLGDPERAQEAWETLLRLTPDDPRVLTALRDLAEERQDGEQFVRYQKQLLSAETDPTQAAQLALTLSQQLETRSAQPQEAWDILLPYLNSHSTELRERYVTLGDQLGHTAQVASTLARWAQEHPPGAERTRLLRQAYERFLQAEQWEQVLSLGLDLARHRELNEESARELERIALQEKNLEVLQTLFIFVDYEGEGIERAAEQVRQAEVLAQAGLNAEEAVLHGEQALTGIPLDQAEPLLARLSQLLSSAQQKWGVYERQIARSKTREERLRALTRAAEEALQLGLPVEAQELYALGIRNCKDSSSLAELLEDFLHVDHSSQGKQRGVLLLQVLSRLASSEPGSEQALQWMAAARLAREHLNLKEKAYELLETALTGPLTEESWQLLCAWAEQDEQWLRVDWILGRVLDQVHEGARVRQLLRYRYELRSEKLPDAPGAREVLKKLYELSPGDQEIAERLEGLYREAQDHIGLVHLYEDLILRSKDPQERAARARQVALIWQDQLEHPRETADAWRRVLRLQPGDEQAKQGLDEAKTKMRTVSVEELNRLDAADSSKASADPTQSTPPAALSSLLLLIEEKKQEEEQWLAQQQAELPQAEPTAPPVVLSVTALPPEQLTETEISGTEEPLLPEDSAEFLTEDSAEPQEQPEERESEVPLSPPRTSSLPPPLPPAPPRSAPPPAPGATSSPSLPPPLPPSAGRSLPPPLPPLPGATGRARSLPPPLPPSASRGAPLPPPPPPSALGATSGSNGQLPPLPQPSRRPPPPPLPPKKES